MRMLHHATALPLALALALFGGQGGLSAATVTNLQVAHRKGQSFLTFREVASSGASYNVYRSRSRITGVSGLSPVATLPQGSGTNLYTGIGFVISDAGAPLPAGTGLLVWTTDESGSFYYAVTNSQDGAIVLGVNSLNSAVVETRTVLPGAVLMEPRTVTAQNYPVFRYFAWEDYRSWDPSTGYYGHRFDVCLEKYPLDPAKKYPLQVILHSAGPVSYHEPDTYMGPGATGIFLFPVDLSFLFGRIDPYTGDERPYSGWWGYATGGVAYNTTQRRVKRYAELLAADPAFQIDTTRIYVQGASMGGGGTLHFAYEYPRFFASAACSTAWVDPQAWGTGYWQTIIGPIPEATPVNSTTGPNWWNWQDMNWLVRSGPVYLPPVIHTFRKDDEVIGEDQYDELLQNLELKRFPVLAEWRNGGHLTFWLSGTMADFRRFRTDEAHPGVFNATSSTAFSAQEGQRNLNIDWSSSLHDLFPSSTQDAIVDTEKTFKMTFQSLNGADASAQITIRNAQRFFLKPGASVTWENRDFTNSQVLASGTVVADANGLVTIPVQILARGNQIVLGCSSCRSDAGLKEIHEFYLQDLSPLVVGQINEAEQCIVARVPANVDLRYVRPTVKFAGVSLTPSSDEEVDFSSAVPYTVEAADGTRTTYTVIVTASSGDPGCSQPPPPPPSPTDTIPPAPPQNLHLVR